ncbi:CBM96 family carbohydrate-binding protein [Paenibacillus planticolens]|uniref:DNRLRE domain-containing protein n=1 Tax=Paenibacillus planticolens TaxID=2654976 RepID=A0ABX1ZPP6_9BACL|nr:DNRLRE domain-containing protein [Paenibacillus planticolens]NOV01613.1 DNRLRE domain-containing protein [Paenibacillus planticolens]
MNLFCTSFGKRFIPRLAAIMSAVLMCSLVSGIWTGNTAEAGELSGASLQMVTMQVYAAEDAYTKGGIDAGNNFGSASVLNVKYSLTTPNSMRESFLKFDLSAVPGRIAHAQLHLYGAAADGTAANGKAVTVSVYQVENDSWSESALTWNTKPAATEAAGNGITLLNRQPEAWYSDDVTAYMKAKQAKGDSWASLALLDQGRADCIVAFNSREAAANRPYLSITYELPASGDTAPPAWPEGSRLTASVSEDGSALLLQWPAAEDESGVAFYRIYANGILRVQLPGDVRSYRLEGVTPGQTVQLQVQAANPGLQWSEPGLSAEVEIPDQSSVPGEEPMPLNAFMSKLGGMSYLPVVKNGQANHWSELEAMELPSDNSQVYVTGWGGASDLSAKVKFAYDEENFYAWFEVKDQVHKGVAGSSMWTGDSIQLAFSADGAAYETEYGLGLTGSVPEVWRWAAGNAQLGKETVSLTAARNESAQTTVYEAAFPWKALFKEKPTDSFRFTYLINDNDGSGRKGWLQWTNGIGLGKDSSQFGTAKLVADGAKWLSWLSAPTSAMAGDTVTRTLDLLNFDQADAALLVRSAELGVDRQITVPAGHAVRLTFPVQYGERGDYPVHFEIEDPVTGEIQTHQSSVSVYESDEQLLARFDRLKSLLPGLKALLDQARQQGIPVDYETVNATVIGDFIQYGKDDILNGEKERAIYVADQLDHLYSEATDNLQAYLEGSKEAKAVQRYRTGSSPIRIDGYSFIADVAGSSGDTVKQDKVIFTGYGHFDEVRRDIPKFSGYGTNLIQVEFGPR